MKVLCIFVTMVMAVKAHYHDRIGIPLAAKVKAYEDKIFVNPQMESRIVGGNIAVDHAFPYMAGLILLLGNGNSSLCGSSLVSTTRLVTAGHCLDRAKLVHARLGSNYLFHGGMLQTTPVFVTHPRFEYIPDYHLKNDVGIVILLEPVKLSETIQVICLPCSKNDIENIGEFTMTAGWGITSDDQRNSAHNKPFDDNWRLSEVGLWLIEPEVCEKKYQLSKYMHGKLLCTDGKDGKAVCDGDSGGPLTLERNGGLILIGIASHGGTACESSVASVFTRTQNYRDFILN